MSALTRGEVTGEMWTSYPSRVIFFRKITHGHPGVLPAARMAKDRWAMASLMAAPSCLPFRMARARQRQWLCSSFLSSSWKMSRIGSRQEESPILISLFSSLRVGEEKAVDKELNEM